jgi:hypothetical protein
VINGQSLLRQGCAMLPSYKPFLDTYRQYRMPTCQCPVLSDAQVHNNQCTLLTTV